MAHLYFLMKEPGQTDRVLIWDTRTLSIGRSPENDLSIDDEEISRKHAMLVNERGSFEIGDYRTGNGTFVNGERVMGKREIRPGDLIGIGKVQLELCHGDEHPAKLGHKLEYASQLKTVGMVPAGADAGSTMLGLADTAPPGDEFVIVPERSTGAQAFTVGADAMDEFQVRDLDDSLDQIDLGFDDALELVDPLDAARASEPQLLQPDPVEAPEASEPQRPKSDPVAAVKARKPQRPKPDPVAAVKASKPQRPKPDPAPRSAPSADPTERLRKLKMLHDEGLITDEEFQAKRAQIIKEM